MQQEIMTLKAVISYWKMSRVYMLGYKIQMTLMHFMPVLLLSYPQMQKYFSQHYIILLLLSWQ